MKRPWQIWSLFVAGLVLVLATFSWLTIKALELDQAQSQAAQLAELDQDVSRALWRMDTLLTPLLAQEAARPEPVYHPLINISAGKGGGIELSPLLVNPPEFVLLHFQLSESGNLTSPQAPQGPTRDYAMRQGVTEQQLVTASNRLVQLTDLLRTSQLLAELPSESIEIDYSTQLGAANRTDPMLSYSKAPVIANVYGRDNFRQIDEEFADRSQQSARVEATPPESRAQRYAISPRSNPSPYDGPRSAFPSPGEPQSGLPMPTPNEQTPADPGTSSVAGSQPQLTQPVGPPAAGPEDPFADSDGTSQLALSPGNQSATPSLIPRAPSTGNQADPFDAEKKEVPPGGPPGEDPFGSDAPAVINESEDPFGANPPPDNGPQLPGEMQGFEPQQTVTPPAVMPPPTQATNPAPSAQQTQQWMAPSPLTRAEPANSVGTYYESLPRGSNDLVNRDRVFQAYAQRQVVEQRQSLENLSPMVPAVEGVSRPLWVRGQLIVARRVMVRGETQVQGCWLDWDSIRARLKNEVSDLLPNAELVRVDNETQVRLGRLLATIPVQLTLPPLKPRAPGFTPIRAALGIAWIALIVAITVAGVLLDRVVQLSERRGAFVAAVTHELRTPLTTFRMYAEMLADGMVTSPAQQQSYLETLRSEADRLAHLVENVLQYARLERTGLATRRQVISLAAVVERSQSRLVARARQASMNLEVVLGESNAEILVETDPAAVDQILSNLVDNACKYASDAKDRRLHLTAERTSRSRVKLVVRDHGPGIHAAGQARLFEPFSKSVHEAADTAPGVGLGLALCLRLARQLGGDLSYRTATEGGAEFTLELPLAPRTAKSS